MNKEKKLIPSREYKVNRIFLDHFPILEQFNFIFNVQKLGLSRHSRNSCKGREEPY